MQNNGYVTVGMTAEEVNLSIETEFDFNWRFGHEEVYTKVVPKAWSVLLRISTNGGALVSWVMNLWVP
jgi:hypothetical protein